MSMRKTMTAAALCTVALGSLIAQPAFAETLLDPSPKATTNNQTAAADITITSLSGTRGFAANATIKFPNGQVFGQIKITAPEGTKITDAGYADSVISEDGKTALLGKNTDHWSGDRPIKLTADKESEAGTVRTGGKVEMVKDGDITKGIDFTMNVTSSIGTVTTPSFSQAYTGVSTINFASATLGQLKITAPTGTKIKSVDYATCVISPDKLTALCGTSTDSWGNPRKVTFDSDGAYVPGAHTDGKVEVIYGGQVVDSHSLAATTTTTIKATDQVVDSGAQATLPLTFSPQIWGGITMKAPEGTTWAATGQPSGSVVSADGKTLTRVPTGSWSGTLNFKINTPANAVPGTVYNGGSATMNAGNVDTARAEFKVTVSNKVTKPVVNVDRNVLSGTGIPGATINVRNDANEIVGTATVDAIGHWSIVVPFQGTGNKTVNVSQVYGTGTSDTVLATINFGNGVQITTPANGSTVTTEKVTFTGTGTVGATIQVNGSTKNICTTEVKNDGTWSCESSIPLPNGPLVFGIKQISGTIESSTTVSFTKKYSNTATPVKVTEPANGTIVYNARPVFKGTGEPGAAIRVFGTSKTVASATVKEDGTWEAPATMDLGGDYKLSVEQTPTNGAATSRETVEFKVRAGEASDVVVTTPAQDSTVTTKTVTYTGKGEPGAKITINGTSKQIASTTVKQDGTWEAIGTFELQNGKYIFKVTQTLANGDMKHTDLTFNVKASY
ncbi:Ig-like domain-containing protein [Mycetocola sp. JXN-3]|uniref:Ig-like domain-containing protein n=1 Tax=Mycetocola sp. JXN-3 TaxID=2116510 RepID=UPI00165D1989|nr:Ig-like domain-containing protein [Mycetocola sp. JXN-3]